MRRDGAAGVRAWARSALAVVALTGCVDWPRYEPQPRTDAGPSLSIEVAPRCVAAGADVAVRWSHRGPCSAIGFSDPIGPSGCALVPVTAPTTLGVTCGEQTSSASVLVDAESSVDERYEVAFFEPVVDGNISEWGVLSQIARNGSENPSPLRPTDDGDLAARFDVAWNERGIVMGIFVTDDAEVSSASTPPDQLWRFDGIELLVDLGADGDDGRGGFEAAEGEAQIFVSRLGQLGKIPSVDTASIEHAVTNDTDAGTYSVEILVPWAVLGSSGGGAGDVLGLNVAVNDVDEGETREGGVPPAMLHHFVLDHPFDLPALPTYTLRCGAQPVARCD